MMHIDIRSRGPSSALMQISDSHTGAPIRGMTRLDITAEGGKLMRGQAEFFVRPAEMLGVPLSVTFDHLCQLALDHGMKVVPLTFEDHLSDASLGGGDPVVFAVLSARKRMDSFIDNLAEEAKRKIRSANHHTNPLIKYLKFGGEQ